MARQDYLSVKEAADRICCSASYVLKLIKRGELPEYKIGNRHFVPVQAAEDYIRRNTTEV
jgi:excisionase family DNA binding protein